MSTAAVRHPAYYADYLALRERLAPGSPSWLNDLRAAAWERFDAAGFPTARRGNERWKYTSVAPIARAEFASPAPHPAGPTGWPSGNPGQSPTRIFRDSWINLVFVDGRPLLDRQPSGAVVGTLAAALASDHEAGTIRDNLTRYATFEDDPFMALNTAFLSDGAYVRLPDDSAEPVFLNIAHIHQGEATVAYPRILVIAGRNTRLTIFESYTGPHTAPSTSPDTGAGSSGAAPRYFTNAVTEISLAEGAQLEHYRLLDESRNAFHVGTTRVRQDKDSSYTSGAFARGIALGRHDLSVRLDGAGAYCSLNGLYLTDDAQHMDNLVSIDHAQPYGTSRLYYKGILDGRSRAVFGGTVLVRENAQKTDAQQTDKNLILSDRAEVDSKPSLLIYADDVKCSHGATAGHIDDDTMFYMRSRGLAPETASRILIHAFASEIIDTVANEPVRDYLDDLFLGAISGKTIPDKTVSGAVNSGDRNPGDGRPLGGA